MTCPKVLIWGRPNGPVSAPLQSSWVFRVGACLTTTPPPADCAPGSATAGARNAALNTPAAKVDMMRRFIATPRLTYGPNRPVAPPSHARPVQGQGPGIQPVDWPGEASCLWIVPWTHPSPSRSATAACGSAAVSPPGAKGDRWIGYCELQVLRGGQWFDQDDLRPAN